MPGAAPGEVPGTLGGAEAEVGPRAPKARTSRLSIIHVDGGGGEVLSIADAKRQAETATGYFHIYGCSIMVISAHDAPGIAGLLVASCEVCHKNHPWELSRDVRTFNRKR